MSIAALTRAPFERVQALISEQSAPSTTHVSTDPLDGHDVYCIVARQPAYASHVAQAHWHTSGEAMSWAALALPCGVVMGSAAAGMSVVSGGVMAVGAMASATVGCITIISAPLLVPVGAALALSSVGTMIWGGILAGVCVGTGAAVTTYEGGRAVVHAARALGEELRAA